MPYEPRYRGTAKQPFKSIDPDGPDDSGLETPAFSDTTLVVSAVAVFVGVLYVLSRRNKERIVTGPLVTVVPDTSADVPQVQNMIGTVNALIKQNELGAV